MTICPWLEMVWHPLLLLYVFLYPFFLTATDRRGLWIPAVLICVELVLSYSAFIMDDFYYSYHAIEHGDALKTKIALLHPLRAHSPNHLYYNYDGKREESTTTPLTAAMQSCDPGIVKALGKGWRGYQPGGPSICGKSGY